MKRPRSVKFYAFCSSGMQRIHRQHGAHPSGEYGEEGTVYVTADAYDRLLERFNRLKTRYESRKRIGESLYV